MSATAKLVATYVAAGLPCEIEAGKCGLVVYAASPATVRAVAQSLANAPRSLRVDVSVSDIARDDDEPEATRFWATVEFDWNAMPSKEAA